MSVAIKVQNIALIYLCAWTIAPPLAYGDEYRVLAVFAALVWGLMELTRSENILRRPSIPVMLCAAYLLYTLGIELSLSSSADLSWHIQPTIMLFFLLVYESRRRKVETLAPVFWWTLAGLPFWLAFSVIGLGESGHAARVIVRSSEEAIELAEQGIGGYALVYVSVLLLPILVSLTLRKGGALTSIPRQLRIAQVPFPLLSGVTAALSLVFILQAQYSIAIYLTVLGFGALLVKRRNLLAVLLIAVPVGLVGLREEVIVQVLDSARSVTEGNVARKLDDILTSLQADYVVGTVSDRIERYERSAELFLESPLMGVLEFSNVGKHSSYLDRFARYGLFIGALFAYLLLYLPVRMVRRMNAGFGMAFAVLVIAILFPLLNNIFMGFGAALYVMFPVACSFFQQERSKGVGVGMHAAPRPVASFSTLSDRPDL